MNPPADITVTPRWIARDGVPWFPVTGEIHYSRISPERWSDVLGLARAGGLTSVATYVFWRHHEPRPGEFDWSGPRDLRGFIRRAAAHGLEVVVRLGPWSHGEVRHGGFPDWLVGSGVPTRRDHPEYLGRVRAFYAQIVAQLEGLTHDDGGPVIAAQIENELADQPEHLATLRTMAEELGLQVPLWTATGWGGARLPESLLPVCSGYADGFWADSLAAWPSFCRVHFHYEEVRDDLGVGDDVARALAAEATSVSPSAAPLPTAPQSPDPQTPFLTCELGGGMHVAYHRRPLVSGEDVAALALATIGSGSVWQGFYMYAGGSNPFGGGAAHPDGEQESQATGYPNDVPQISYDFGAPIGEHGRIRPHYEMLRRQHLWLAADGHRLAAMRSRVGGGSAEDPHSLRWAVRSDGDSGYLFLSTYVPDGHLDPQPALQLRLGPEQGLDASQLVPHEPVDLPAGISTVWPVNLPLDERTRLVSATAELLTRREEEGGAVVVLTARRGIPVQLLLAGAVEVSGPCRATGTDDGDTFVELTADPGPEVLLTCGSVRLLILDEATADQLAVLPVDGRESMVLCSAPVHAEPVHADSVRPAATRLVVHTEEPEVTLDVWQGAGTSPRWRRRLVSAPRAGQQEVLCRSLVLPATAPQPRVGGPEERLAAPADFSGAAVVELSIPEEHLEDEDQGSGQLLLRVDWTGDVGRARLGDRLISDHFWHGREWEMDLTPWREELRRGSLTLELLPWCAASGVWVHPSVREVEDGVVVRSARLIRRERVVVTG
ncbi:beta-galactosidase [Nesterenkonia xinjiangensis]|uniref:Glycoside hydrolase 35 catalytic domain-containing protein n=1 Tax=Nesterenkonia xinjiangensis TaxID=225327 RepID=A0A7Z0GMD5_9MICC|nr:beta-galactosidase [Nesterenkonia xinjiangensis]NYJ77851.1 hypothetical protein [Nesterenkonia xinjiangensis]